MTFRTAAACAATAVATLLASAAFADPAAAPATPAPAAATAATPAAPPASWASTIKLTGRLDVGATMNGDSPQDGLNFGHLFTDKANQVMLNAATVTLERDPDTASKTVDVGFKVQATYGADSRYTQLIGQFNDQIKGLNQFDLVEANVQAHLPILTAGGMEFKAGQYVTLEGAETIDPTGNFFYSHSYLFNFGIPLKHTGIMTETHVSPIVDLYLGVDSGENTFLGKSGGANDDVVHFHGGLGLNLKNLTILATTHIGPEDYSLPTPGKLHDKNRYLNDVVVTWKATDKWTAIADINETYDEGYKAGAEGVTGYLTYTVSPAVSIGARAEVWKDEKNFYVAAYPGSFDFINYEGGYKPSAPLFVPTGHAVTYSELTVGVNMKPQGLPKRIDGLTIRPEIRYDGAESHVNPYDGFTKPQQLTFGLDVILPFSVF